jgi:hypothetical protein
MEHFRLGWDRLVSKAIIDMVLKKGEKNEWGDVRLQASCTIGEHATNWTTVCYMKASVLTMLINS